MLDYKVKQGDCLASIAYRRGFFWDTLWNHPKNAALKKKRRDPSVLFPGDRVFIPDAQAKQEDCATEQRHQFCRKGVPEQLRIILLDRPGNPRANLQYSLTIDGVKHIGSTDSSGKIEISISPTARSGRLQILDDKGTPIEVYSLGLGKLDPVSETSGQQARLSSLGFECGPIDGILGPLTRAAITAFQMEQDLKATGKPDSSTLQKLQDVYGS
ncbi:peptidoglycan-binding protein [Acidobacteriota bacterium]